MHIFGMNLAIGEIAKEFAILFGGPELLKSFGQKTGEAVANRVMKNLRQRREELITDFLYMESYAGQLGLEPGDPTIDEVRRAGTNILVHHGLWQTCAPRTYGNHTPYDELAEDRNMNILGNWHASFDAPPKPEPPPLQQVRPRGRGQQVAVQQSDYKLALDDWNEKVRRLSKERLNTSTRFGLKSDEERDKILDGLSDDAMEKLLSVTPQGLRRTKRKVRRGLALLRQELEDRGFRP